MLYGPVYRKCPEQANSETRTALVFVREEGREVVMSTGFLFRVVEMAVVTQCVNIINISFISQ